MENGESQQRLPEDVTLAENAFAIPDSRLPIPG
ncbi:adenylyltransferase, partial [Xanthomonas perforans]